MSGWWALWMLACGGDPVGVPVPPDPVVTPTPDPTPDPEVAHAVAVDGGEGTTCVTRADGRVTCVGAHELQTGAAGVLTVTDTEICQQDGAVRRCFQGGRPVPDDESPFVEQTRGAGSPCGRDADGAVWCWSGRPDDAGALSPVPLPAAAERIVADGSSTCAVLVDATLHCWDPMTVRQARPEVHEVDHHVRQIGATWLLTCWRTDRSVVCRRGGGSLDVVPGLLRPTDLAVGRMHACATQDGVVQCWGDNTWAQIGSGGASTTTPLPVLGAHGALALSAGDDHTCALLDGGRVHCWGRNDHDQVTAVRNPPLAP